MRNVKSLAKAKPDNVYFGWTRNQKARLCPALSGRVATLITSTTVDFHRRAHTLRSSLYDFRTPSHRPHVGRITSQNHLLYWQTLVILNADVICAFSRTIYILRRRLQDICLTLYTVFKGKSDKCELASHTKGPVLLSIKYIFLSLFCMHL